MFFFYSFLSSVFRAEDYMGLSYLFHVSGWVLSAGGKKKECEMPC